MPIPNADLAIVSFEKLADYLLNVSHPVGGSKARWFVSLGYHPSSPERLASDLLEMVRRSDAFSTRESPFGVKYIVSSRLMPPSGQPANVVSVWITEPGDRRPRLVSAYPAKRASDE